MSEKLILKKCDGCSRRMQVKKDRIDCFQCDGGKLSAVIEMGSGGGKSSKRRQFRQGARV